MKALSIRQPWAWAICNAGKRVENRAWLSSPGMVGAARKLVGQDILVHAAQGAQRRYFEYSKASILSVNGTVHVPALAVLPRGAIVATARLDALVRTLENGCRVPVDNPLATCLLCRSMPPSCAPCPSAAPWAIHGTVGLILDDVRLLATPVPFRGSLGFFEVHDYLIGGAS